MKILLLNQTFHPDVVATAQYAGDFAASLVERGHEVTVVCSRRAYDKPSERYAAREVWRGINIRRIGCSGFGKKARWRRAADFGSYIMNCALHLLALRRFDVVVGMTSPPLVSWLGARFAHIKGETFVSWVMDLNPDEALAAGWLRERSWTTRFLQHLLHQSLERSAVVIVLDRFMAKRVADKGIDPRRIAIVPPWSHDDVLRFDASGREQFRNDHGLNGKFVVMFSGNHTPCHPLATLLQAALTLRDRADVAFCFVGGGSELENVRRFAAGHDLKNVVMVPYQPLNKLSASLSAADLHTVVMGDPFVGIIHPSKVYNIRALGIPYLYIGPSESHITELSPTYAVRHGDATAVVHCVQSAAASGSWDRTVTMPPMARTQANSLDEMLTAVESVAFQPGVASLTY